MSRQMWRNGAQARQFEEIVRRYPIREGEGTLAYAERIALLAGELKVPMLLPPGADLTRGEQVQIQPVSREPGEDDDEQ